MTWPHHINVEKLLADQLATSPDLLRRLLSTFIQALMSVEADALCGATTANAAPSGPIAATDTGIGFRYPRRHDRHGHSQAALRQLFFRSGY